MYQKRCKAVLQDARCSGNKRQCTFTPRSRKWTTEWTKPLKTRWLHHAAAWVCVHAATEAGKWPLDVWLPTVCSWDERWFRRHDVPFVHVYAARWHEAGSTKQLFRITLPQMAKILHSHSPWWRHAITWTNHFPLLRQNTDHIFPFLSFLALAPQRVAQMSIYSWRAYDAFLKHDTKKYTRALYNHERSNAL